MTTEQFIRWMLENCGRFTLDEWTEWMVTGYLDRYNAVIFKHLLEDAFGDHIDITETSLPHIHENYTRLSFIYRR